MKDPGASACAAKSPCCPQAGCAGSVMARISTLALGPNRSVGGTSESGVAGCVCSCRRCGGDTCVYCGVVRYVSRGGQFLGSACFCCFDMLRGVCVLLHIFCVCVCV